MSFLKNIIKKILDFLYLSKKKTPQKILEYSSFELELVSLVNTLRNEYKLNKWGLNSEISTVAKRHSVKMNSIKELSHRNFTERQQYLFDKINAKSVSEVLAYKNTPGETLKGWMKSKEHKEVLLSKFTTSFGLSNIKSHNGYSFITLITVRK